MGPSNSGKSTLAQAIARARDLEAVHLDRLHHLPHTDWVPRPESEFTMLHDAAVRVEIVVPRHPVYHAVMPRLLLMLLVGVAVSVGRDRSTERVVVRAHGLPAAVFASILIVSIPTMLVFLFTQRTIMRGIAVPAEK